MNVSYFKPDREGLAESAMRQVEEHFRRGEITAERISEHITDLAHELMVRLEKNEALRETFRRAQES